MKQGTGRPPKHIFHRLEVGESVFIAHLNWDNLTRSVYSSHIGKKYTCSVHVENGEKGILIERVE